MWALAVILGLLALGALQAEGINTSLIHPTQKTNTPKKHPPKNKPQKPPKSAPTSERWIYSSAFLTAYFSDGHYKQGYGLLLSNGNYLSASSLVFDQGMYAQTIMARMQDDSAPLLICVARLRLKAIDRNRGLSLLGTHLFTNDNCQVRPESYYHARIYKKYAQNLLTHSQTPSTKALYYPQVGSQNAFEIQSLHHPSSLQDTPLGRPLFDAHGVFMGMLGDQQNQIKVIKRGVITDFLRAMQKHKLL
ncbi:Periplasmic protein [Helicobacter bizzozeronii]|uniref:hypothetical protein n=1 Tax=Helicobacter bizzozeronii TaxID=56877 RepID=UPI00244D85D6|nr:hypothetical protein [Helicobacter bizzozeronii]GMB92693.1 Periplasmic protein [Helicobacter bizzozeronii]